MLTQSLSQTCFEADHVFCKNSSKVQSIDDLFALTLCMDFISQIALNHCCLGNYEESIYTFSVYLSTSLLRQTHVALRTILPLAKQPLYLWQNYQQHLRNHSNNKQPLYLWQNYQQHLRSHTNKSMLSVTCCGRYWFIYSVVPDQLFQHTSFT